MRNLQYLNGCHGIFKINLQYLNNCHLKEICNTLPACTNNKFSSMDLFSSSKRPVVNDFKIFIICDKQFTIDVETNLSIDINKQNENHCMIKITNIK